MRRQIAWLVVAATSAVVVAFVVPLCLLVQGIASDRAIEAYRLQAQNAAVVLGSAAPSAARQLVQLLVEQGAQITAVLPDGRVTGVDPQAGQRDSVRRAQTERAAFTEPTPDGVDIVIPVASAGGTTVVLASVPADELRAGVAQAWMTIVALGTALVAIAVWFAARLGRRISEPVTDLAAVAHRLREGDVTARVSPAGPPETQELAAALNQLAERIDGLVESGRAEAADLGHRLRTPVTALRLDTDLVADPVVAERLRGHVDQLQRSIDTVVRDARRRVRDSMPVGCDAGAVATARAAFWAPLAEDQGRRFDVDVAGVVPVALPAADLAELLDTLLDNVFAHTPEGMPVRVVVVRSAGRAVIDIEDGGPGMTDTVVRRGVSGAGSTGLGLDIVRRLTTSVGGELLLERAELGGLRARVLLPSTVDGTSRDAD